MDIRERISELVDKNNDTLWIGEVSPNSIELDGCLTIESLRGIVDIMSKSVEVEDSVEDVSWLERCWRDVIFW